MGRLDDITLEELHEVREQTEGEKLAVWYFPSKLPELNPVEGCWNQLYEWFKHRLIPDLSTLKASILKGIDAIDEPNIWNYLCSTEG